MGTGDTGNAHTPQCSPHPVVPKPPTHILPLTRGHRGDPCVPHPSPGAVSPGVPPARPCPARPLRPPDVSLAVGGPEIAQPPRWVRRPRPPTGPAGPGGPGGGSEGSEQGGAPPQHHPRGAPRCSEPPGIPVIPPRWGTGRVCGAGGKQGTLVGGGIGGPRGRVGTWGPRGVMGPMGPCGSQRGIWRDPRGHWGYEGTCRDRGAPGMGLGGSHPRGSQSRVAPGLSCAHGPGVSSHPLIIPELSLEITAGAAGGRGGHGHRAGTDRP